MARRAQQPSNNNNVLRTRGAAARGPFIVYETQRCRRFSSYCRYCLHAYVVVCTVGPLSRSQPVYEFGLITVRRKLTLMKNYERKGNGLYCTVGKTKIISVQGFTIFMRLYNDAVAEAYTS